MGLATVGASVYGVLLLSKVISLAESHSYLL